MSELIKKQFFHRIEHNEVGGVLVLRRESYVLYTAKGAVEAHRHPSVSQEFRGGIEIHSPVPLYDLSAKPFSLRCDWTKTGECWTDGSGLAFYDIENLFDNPLAIRNVLEGWYFSNFVRDLDD